jgi:hypothetical protein
MTKKRPAQGRRRCACELAFSCTGLTTHEERAAGRDGGVDGENGILVDDVHGRVHASGGRDFDNIARFVGHEGS